jgi:hypothetical protein
MTTENTTAQTALDAAHAEWVASITEDAIDHQDEIAREREWLAYVGIPAPYHHLTPSEQAEQVIEDQREEAEWGNGY